VLELEDPELDEPAFEVDELDFSDPADFSDPEGFSDPEDFSAPEDFSDPDDPASPGTELFDDSRLSVR
jgi:hypothetical protein